MKVAFIHPDLGIGGAERLVVDAAVGLQNLGHEVTIYTSHHDPTHCFEETKNGMLNVQVYGDFLPRSIFGKGYIIFAILRNLYLSCCLILKGIAPDVFFVDQLSISIPVLRMSGRKIFFYCHFPDKLLSKRDSFIKSLYRIPVDYMEELTTRMSDVVVVNSKFTQDVFKQSFKSIQTNPAVLYPSIKTESYDAPLQESDPSLKCLNKNKTLIVSLNRFERKKNVGLAIEAFAKLRDMAPSQFGTLQLVIAGGYDTRVTENVEYLKELESLAEKHNLTSTVLEKGQTTASEAQVVFLRSFTESQRTFLLSRAICLLYTPSREHFGIGPVEAMYAQLPVVAVNDGGPTESVVDGETGFLREQTAEEFASPIMKLIADPSLKAKLGRAGRERVKQKFTLEAFVRNFESILQETLKSKNQEAQEVFASFWSFVLAAVVLVFAGVLSFGWFVSGW